MTQSADNSVRSWRTRWRSQCGNRVPTAANPVVDGLRANNPQLCRPNRNGIGHAADCHDAVLALPANSQRRGHGGGICVPPIVHSAVNAAYVRSSQVFLLAIPKNRNRRAPQMHKAVSPRIAHLLDLCRPAAILRRVTLVVVNAIKACSIWSRPHVITKGGEGLIPSGANRNPATPIEGVHRVFRIVTTPAHILPRYINRVGGKSMKLSLLTHIGFPSIPRGNICTYYSMGRA